MSHEIIGKTLRVSETDISFERIYKKPYIPSEYRDEIQKANFLIIPNENFRDEGDVLFPETTREFFEFVRENSNNEVIADIAISDEDFQRIELHSAAIDVATIIVESALFSIALNIISSFLYDLVMKYHRKPDETSAKVKIITEETATKKTKMITYEGPVSGVKESLEQAAKDLFAEK